MPEMVCKSSELTVKMPQLLRRSRSVVQKFPARILAFSKKKKKTITLTKAFFSRHGDGNIHGHGAGNCSCLRFLAGNKNTGFWLETKTLDFAKFSAEMLKKILQFFAFIGNTDHKH